MFTLTRDHLVYMLKDPGFYEAVPAFSYLQLDAEEGWRLYQSVNKCQRCETPFSFMRPVCDDFFEKLKEFKQIKHEALGRVKQWLSEKKHRPISRCVIYYRRSVKTGKIEKLEF